VIEARGLFERHLHGRRLAAGLAVLVVMLVVLVGIHPISDEVTDHAALVCAAAVLVLGFSLFVLGEERSSSARAPVGRADQVPRASSSPPALVHLQDISLPLLR
jgi:hypothetical protein